MNTFHRVDLLRVVTNFALLYMVLKLFEDYLQHLDAAVQLQLADTIVETRVPFRLHLKTKRPHRAYDYSDPRNGIVSKNDGVHLTKKGYTILKKATKNSVLPSKRKQVYILKQYNLKIEMRKAKNTAQ